MATQPTLASLLGSSDKRKQVSLDLGQQALTPQVQRAGQRTVFAAPTVAAEQTSAGRLAAALSDVSPVLRQYTDLTYTQGQTEAAAVLPGNAEAQLKKMEPDTWLNMARQRGLREGLVKKHFNHNLLPEFKEQAKEYQNFEKYPTIEKATEAFDGYIADRWSQYVEEMPDGIGGSLESKVLWSSITGNVRNGVVDSYNRNLDKFNVSTISDETQQKWSALTVKDDEGNVDYNSAIPAIVSDFYSLGEKAGLTPQDITDRLRTDMLRRVEVLQRQGNNEEALTVIKELQNYQRNGQPIFRDSATEVQLAEVQQRADNAIEAESRRSASDVTKERELLSKRVTNMTLNGNSGDVSVLEDPEFANIVKSFTNASVDEVKAEIESHMATGMLEGDAFLKTMNRLSVVNSAETQRDAWTEVASSSRGSIDRHYSLNQRRTKLEIGQQESFLSNYRAELKAGQTSKGIVAYAEEQAKQLSDEQLQKGKAIYDASSNYLNIKRADKDVNDLFISELKALAKSGRNDTAASYGKNILVNELDPLYEEQGTLERIPTDERTPEQQERLKEIPSEIQTKRENAKRNYKIYEEELDLFTPLATVLPVGVPKEDVSSKIKLKSGKTVKLETLAPLKTRAYRSPGMAGIGRVEESREWTPEEISEERQTMAEASATDALELSIHLHPFELDLADPEDFSTKVKQLDVAGVDVTDKLIFGTNDMAFEIIHGARLAVEELEKGQLDMTDPTNRALISFAQINGITGESDEDKLLLHVRSQFLSQNQ